MTQTQLNSRNNSTAQSIAQLTEQLAQMQQMILNLQGEVRTLNQQHKAQETLSKEWANTCNHATKQFKDACSVYGTPDAIDDMVTDILNEAEAVKAEFDKYAQSDRFLNQETAEVEDVAVNNVVQLMPTVDVLPDEDDNETILTPHHITILLNQISEDTVKELKALFNINNRLTKMESIASALSKHKLTHSKLARLIKNIEGQQLLLAGL